MTGRPLAEDPRLLSVASSISDGVAVDWDRVPRPDDEETTEVLDQLRLIEGLSRLGDPMPNTWGPFTITGEIGHGSFGTVYRAIDPALNMEIALKVIRPRALADALDPSRALSEARLLAQVNDRHVVRVFRAERIGDEIGVAMELIKGRTLHDLVRRQGPLSAAETIDIGMDVCRALAAVHDAQLVHGDVKAQNVMRANDGRSVLMDFGAGHDLKRARALPGSGTPLYMAPEVIAGNAPTPVSDTYSLGVLLYYLVTGSYPVEGDTRTDVRRRHVERASRRRLIDARPDLHKRFVRVVERATAERASERYQTARAFEAALDRARRQPSVPWRIVAGSAAAVAVLSLTAFLAYKTLQVDRPSPPTTGPAAAVTTSATPAVAAPDSYRIEAAVYRDDNGTDVPLSAGARVAPGDRLSLQLRSTVPLNVYVVNEDDLGESFLLFPLPGQDLANPLPANTRHRLPGRQSDSETYWQVTSAGGRERFVVFAGPEPFPATLLRVFDSLPRPAAGRPIDPPRLPEEAVTVLRGIGGLATKPVAAGVGRVSDDSYAPLAGAEEETRGMWVRQLTLQNPGK